MHYLYIYLDPRKPGKFTYGNFVSFMAEPIYIGKCKGNRLYAHLHEQTWVKTKQYNTVKKSKIKKILEAGMTPIISILEYGTEDYILNLEKFYIELIGRMVTRTGPLTNVKIDNSYHNPNKDTTTRQTNYRQGRRFKTITNGEITIRAEDKFLDDFMNHGFDAANWAGRALRNNSKSRANESNGMYNKSAVKGRKWVLTEDGNQLFLLPEEIQALKVRYTYGRRVDKNKRQRVIIKGNRISTYMTEEDIQSLPKGTEYQIGLIWKLGRQTFKV